MSTPEPQNAQSSAVQWLWEVWCHGCHAHSQSFTSSPSLLSLLAGGAFERGPCVRRLGELVKMPLFSGVMGLTEVCRRLWAGERLGRTFPGSIILFSRQFSLYHSLLTAFNSRLNFYVRLNCPFPNYLRPIFQSESRCSPFICKSIFIHMQIKLIN